MKILISVDAEGLPGLTTGKQTLPNYSDYGLARTVMTDFVNSASQGALEGKASSVTVVDSHDGNRNIFLKDLFPHTKLISGWPKELSMVEGIREADRVYFLGYHSMAGTENGVLNHTYSATVVHRLKYNGTEIGEIGMSAYVAGHFNKPVSLVAGDKAAVEEAKKIVPDAIQVVFKEALSRYAANNQPYNDALEELRMRSREASSLSGSIAKIEGEIEISLEFQNTGQADNCMLLSDVSRENGYTVVTKAMNAVEAYKKFRVLVSLASFEQFGY